MRSIKISGVLGLLLTSLLCSGQMDIAESQYQSGEYQVAILNYLAEYSNGESNDVILSRIGHCYDRLNQPQKSVDYLTERKLGDDLNAADLKVLGLNLLKTGAYNKAYHVFEDYAKFDETVGYHYMAYSKYANKLNEQLEEFLIYPLSIDTKGDEFGPAFNAEKFVFNQYMENDNGCSYPILTAEGERTNFDQATLLHDKLSSKENLIYVHYSPSNTKVVFTKVEQSCFNGILSDKSMSIYEADVDKNGSWNNVRALPFNKLGSRVAYASYGSNDNTLFFCSDEMGGKGGFDIYVSQRINNNNWKAPKTVEGIVNTKGDEIAPRWNGKYLTFASNYHLGLGGFDIFYAFKNDGGFDQVENPGRPLNSPMDDWCATFVDQESGYFCTNRTLNQTGIDVYYFESIKETKPEVISVANLEEETLSKDYKVMLPLNLNTSNFSTSPVKKLYSIQIAVLGKGSNDFQRFQSELGNIDQLYKIFYDDVVKIRLGTFNSEIDAEKALVRVKAKGYNDAFIVEEQMLVANDDNVVEEGEEAKITNPSSTYKPYKIRLATYSKPEYFQRSKVEHLGTITSFKKDQYTIFLLGDYDDVQTSERILTQVKKAGFDSAQIVIQDGDTFRRIK